MAYYVLIDNEQAGPFESATIAEMAKRGEVTGDMLVWAAGMDDWAPACEVPELADLFPDEPPDDAQSDNSRAPPRQIAPGAEQPLDMGRAFGAARDGFKRQPGPALIIALIYGLVSIAVIWISFGPDYAFGALDGQEPAAADTSLAGIGFIMLFGLMPILYGGLAMAMLDLVRGEPVRLERIVAGFPRMWPLIIFFVLYMMSIGIGMFLLIVPAIFIAVSFALAPFIIMDSGLGTIEAMKESYKAIMGLGWWRCFALLAGIMLALMIAITLVSGILTGLGGTATPMGLVISNLVTLLLNAVFTVLLHGTVAGIYEQARENHQRVGGSV
ncbi:MAG: GYF domain-containing protein [Alphaproteobacteria bacterium]